MNFRDYLTIGEVVQKLQVQYEDLSVSKLRFLEDEGLIEPERTSGGYRKYSRDDLKRIELILRLQREKFMPLAIIKVKLDEYERGLVAPELADILQAEANGKTAAGASGSADADAATAGTIVANGVGTGDGYSSAHDYVSDEQRYALDQDAATVVSVAEMVRDEKIPEQFFAELKRYGIVEMASAVGSGAGTLSSSRLTAADAACVRAAWALRSVGIEPRHLRMYATFADKEALIYEQFLRPTFRHKTPRSREMLGTTAADIARQTELLKRRLLQRELKNKLGDLL